MPRENSQLNLQPEVGNKLWVIAPPHIVKKVKRYYGDRPIPPRALRPFWRRMEEDPRYKRRIYKKVDDILAVMLDETTPSPGDWPQNLRDILGVFRLVGGALQTAMEETLLELPEAALAAFEEEVKRTGRSYEEIFIRFIQKLKYESQRG